MKTNEELQKDVQNAINWEPLMNATKINVTAKDGVVTLFGVVDSYSKKIEAEITAKNVDGVKVVAENLEVNYGSLFRKNDIEIAIQVLNAWKWNWEVPGYKIEVKVKNGWVTLEGELEWNYQKEAAKKAVFYLAGVKGVSNNITINSNSNNAVEQSAVESALERSWAIDNEDIEVKVCGNKITLTGTVSSLYQKDEAGRLAWNAPGVYAVHNDLLVDFDG